jgi:tetratricopeptide (TPR) repeat protein
MIQTFFRNPWVMVALLIPLAGCAALPAGVRSDAPVPPQVVSSGLSTFHYAAAILQALNDNPEEAIRELEEALRIDPASPYLAKELASLYAEKGEMGKALALSQKLIDSFADDSEIRLFRTGIYLNQKDYPAAEEEARRAVKLDAQSVTAYLYLGTSLAELKRYAEAVAVFEDLVRIDPNHFMGNYYRARILFELQRDAEAEAAFQKTIALRPQFESVVIDLARLYERQNKTDRAIELYREFTTAFPARLQARIRLGELFLKEQRFDEAEATFLEVLHYDPAHREVRLTLGLISLERGLHDKAIEIFSALTGEYPQEYRLRYLLGTTYEGAKRNEKALQTFREIPAMAEQFANAQVRIAMILKKMGEIKEAIAALQTAIEQKRDAAGLYAFLASLYGEEKDFTAAEGLIRSGLGVIPESTDLHYALGVLYEKTDRFEAAIEAMRKVISLDPDHAEALNFIGYLYADRGIHLDEAKRLIQKALQLKPGNPYMTDSLGWVYFRQNRLDEALHHLKQAAEALPEDPVVLEHLGDIYERMGRTVEALEAYDRALRQSPDNEALQKKRHELLRQKNP